ncbi:hypothetical protein ABEB36_012231 [Hypothenemus hampei]|uniref:JmjC domain-containing protein n=1 Tax=Hypothenemus hampei TaxID=57062 RepID=A0ABD1EAM2_HYPHA
MCDNEALNSSLIAEALKVLYAETEDFLYRNKEIPEISYLEIQQDTWPIIFLRDYVSRNFPVLIKGGANHFPAVQKWDSQFFMNNYPEKIVTLTVTPNGYADGVAQFQEESHFFLPEEVQMKFKDFLTHLKEKRNNYVTYIQQQNSNLTENYPELLPDIEEFKWASKAFNKKPDAINFWMGDQRAVSSMHKDPYENIYCVIDGYKDFILIPPVDLPYVPYEKYLVKRYKHVTPEGFDVEHCSNETIYWISENPLIDTHSLARKYHIRVCKGDVLYLPSLWFHHVRQSHECIAVNYWYDIEYSDLKYCFYKMLASLCGKSHVV